VRAPVNNQRRRREGGVTTAQRYIAVGPFAQARETAQQDKEEERADHNLREVTFKREKKGLCSSTKMDSMRR
jgi:hypothetical protein